MNIKSNSKSRTRNAMNLFNSLMNPLADINKSLVEKILTHQHKGKLFVGELILVWDLK